MTGDTAPLAEDAFRDLLDRRARELLQGALHVRSAGGKRECFTRPLLQRLLSGASELEELLDAYGASRNRRWYSLRHAVATVKIFSQVAYSLEHLLLFMSSYRLRPVGHDFRAQTEESEATVCGVVARGLDTLVTLAQERGVGVGAAAPAHDTYDSRLPPGHLPADRTWQNVSSAEQTVTTLCTAFLNLSEGAPFIHAVEQTKEKPPQGWIPDPINERVLRDLEQRFHNLQSLYDTYISDTNVETLDRDLPVLRGHVAVLYHLLDVSTHLTHYCERHVLTPDAPAQEDTAPQIVDRETIVELLAGYSLAFVSRYLLAARGLCHEMLKRYAIPGTATLPIPRYRGFHVRPSTLVAQIVAHYGGEVTMELDGESYNAGFTLDLFRANEKINAAKRRQLANDVHRKLGSLGDAPPGAAAELVGAVAQQLYAERRLLIYDRALALEGFAEQEGETVAGRVTRALTHLLSLGKVDVEMELNALFKGDLRVLEDIRLLAQHGYGEDDFGNNLPLPAPLSYLRK